MSTDQSADQISFKSLWPSNFIDKFESFLSKWTSNIKNRTNLKKKPQRFLSAHILFIFYDDKHIVKMGRDEQSSWEQKNHKKQIKCDLLQIEWKNFQLPSRAVTECLSTFLKWHCNYCEHV